MQEHIETFRKCCTALLTGINIAQADSWLTALKNEGICLPLCIAVVAAADAASIHSAFIACKIVHNVFRENRYSATVDLEYMLVLMNALFYRESISHFGPTTTAVHRQLCLCIAAALITFTSQSAPRNQLIQGLAQLATESKEGLVKVLRILEEVPTEIDCMTSIGGAVSANHRLLLTSLRNVLLSAVECSSLACCKSLADLLNLTEEQFLQQLNIIGNSSSNNNNNSNNNNIDNSNYSNNSNNSHNNNSDTTSSVTAEVSASAAGLRAIYAWSTATCTSTSNNTDEQNDQNGQNGLNHNNCSDYDSGGLISLHFVSMSAANGSCESYFESLHTQMRYTVRVLMTLNASRGGVAGFTEGQLDSQSEDEGEVFGVQSSEMWGLGGVQTGGTGGIGGQSGGQSEGQSGGQTGVHAGVQIFSEQLCDILVLGCHILTEWLATPSPFDTAIEYSRQKQQQQQQHFTHAQQQQALNVPRAIYRIFLLIVEVWDLIIRCDSQERGLVLWMQQLTEYSDTSRSPSNGNNANNANSANNNNHNTNYALNDPSSTNSGKGGNNLYGNVRAIEVLEISGIVPLGARFLGSGMGSGVGSGLGSVGPGVGSGPGAGPLVAALIDLTATFTEKHSSVLFGSDPACIAARGVTLSYPPMLPDLHGICTDNPSAVLVSCVLCCVSVDKTAALGAVELVTFLGKAFPQELSRSLLEPLVGPISSVLIAQNCYCSVPFSQSPPSQSLSINGLAPSSSHFSSYPSLAGSNSSQWTSQGVSQSTPQGAAHCISQEVWVEFEAARGESGVYLPGGVEDQLEATVAFRKESSFILQTVCSQWCGGDRVWGRLSGLLQVETARLISLMNSSNSNSSSHINNNSNNNYNNNSSGSNSSIRGPQIGQEEWLCCRHIECLLFMLASLTDCVHESHQYSPEPPVSPFQSASKLQHINNLNAISRNNNYISDTQGASNGSRSGWLADISKATLQLVENHMIRDIILGRHPAIAIRLLELWIAIKEPTAGPVSDISAVILSVLQFACTAVEMLPQGFILGPAFDLIASMTKEFKSYLSEEHSLSLVEWLMAASTHPSVLKAVNKSPQRASAVYCTLGRVVMLLSDDPTHTGRTRGHYISLVLTSLTTSLELPSSITPPSLSSALSLHSPSPLSQPGGLSGGGSGGGSIMFDSESVHGMLLRCHWNLSHLKGFIRGLTEKNVSDEDDEEEEGDEEEVDEDMDGDASKAAIFAVILPQLCGGLFALLESIVSLSIDSEQHAQHARHSQHPQHPQQTSPSHHSHPSHPSNTSHSFPSHASPSPRNIQNSRNSLLLSDVITGVCSTLCSLIDSPHPCHCPSSSLHTSAERISSLLSRTPLTCQISPLINIATAVIRQCSDSADAPVGLLSLLPHICLKRSILILRALSTPPNPIYPTEDPGRSGPNSLPNLAPDSGLETVLETLRLVRQCCIACPAVLSIPASLPGEEVTPPGGLFFECFGLLLKAPGVLYNGALLRMMNTALSVFCKGASRSKSHSFSHCASSPLVLSGYIGSYTQYLGRLIGTLLYSGLFGDDERAVRPFAGYLETLILLYRENVNCVDLNLCVLLGELCSAIGMEISRIGGVCGTAGVGGMAGAGGGVGSAGVVFVLPFVDPEPLILTDLEFMRVVYDTLKHYAESPQSVLIRQSFLDLCTTCRLGRVAAVALKSVGSEKQREDVYRRATSNCKLIVIQPRIPSISGS